LIARSRRLLAADMPDARLDLIEDMTSFVSRQ
jgi:hypothetical protein